MSFTTISTHYFKSYYRENMFITTVVAAGYLLYLERKLAKEEEVIARTSFPKDKKMSPKNTPRQIIEQLLAPFQEEKRSQQLETMAQQEKTAEEKQLDGKLEISAAMLGLAIAGSLVAAPLTYVSLAGSFWVSKEVYKTAYDKLKNRKLGIELLDSIAFTSILGLGYATLGSVGCLLYFGSKKLLLKTEDYSSSKLINVFGEQPKTVWIVVNKLEIEIPFEQLEKGSVVSIHAGNMIPIDGQIVHGYALVDQQALTGESQPAEKKVGDTCFASTIVLEGTIHIKVEKAGEETVTAQIGQILNNSIDFKEVMISKGERLADESTLPLIALGLFSMPFIGVIGGAAIFNASFGFSMRMVSPMLMLNFLTIASNRGILIKDGRSLEFLNQIDTVVFDKTGTLTMNQPRVASIHTLGDFSENQLLAYAAAAEYKQSHPIALAIIQEAIDRQLILPTIEATKYEVGYGIKVNVGAKTIRLGSARFMKMEKILLPDTIDIVAEEGQKKGYSFVYIAINEALVGAIELHPTIRPEAKQIIRALKAQRKTCYIISGDHLSPTRHLAKQLGIDNYFAEVLPEDKANLIEQLQKKNKKVCFIGDGINDSIALKKADVSISLRGASTIATDTAQIVFMNESLEQLPFIFELGQEFDKYMDNNIMSSVVPSVITIGGAFFFSFGLITSSVINQLGLIVGVGNSFHPLVKIPQEKEPLAIPESLPLNGSSPIPKKGLAHGNTSINDARIKKKEYQSKPSIEEVSVVY